MSSKEWDASSFEIVLVGDDGVGKKEILRSYSDENRTKYVSCDRGESWHF